jgi:hypothetical protein
LTKKTKRHKTSSLHRNYDKSNVKPIRVENRHDNIISKIGSPIVPIGTTTKLRRSEYCRRYRYQRQLLRILNNHPPSFRFDYFDCGASKFEHRHCRKVYYYVLPNLHRQLWNPGDRKLISLIAKVYIFYLNYPYMEFYKINNKVKRLWYLEGDVNMVE